MCLPGGTRKLLDVVAALLISWAIGFHPLLPPAFALEFLPVADVLTWTGCVRLVVIAPKTGAATSSGPGTLH